MYDDRGARPNHQPDRGCGLRDSAAADAASLLFLY
jgi:hypothetical protein